MTALLYRNIPPLVEQDKDSRSGINMAGINVFQSELIRALLTHGTYDEYYFLWDGPESIVEGRKRLAQYPNHKRAKVVTYEDISKFDRHQRLIGFNGNAFINELSHLRRWHGATWPVSGVTISLSYQASQRIAVAIMLEGLYKYDSLICASEAGRRVVENIFHALSSFINERCGQDLQPTCRLPVIPLAIDAALFAPRDRQQARQRFQIPPDVVVFLCIGRLSPVDKGDPFPLLLAFKQFLQGFGGRAALILAGDDTRFNIAPKLRAFAASLGLTPEQMVVIPNIKSEDKLWLYSAADVFISLSDSVQETFGLAVTEAMAAALPVIGSDWDGYRETIEHGRTGFLAPTRWAGSVDEISRLGVMRGDAGTHWLLAQSVVVELKAVAEYMRVLGEDAELRREMGEAGRRRVLERFDWPVVIKAYEEMWEQSMQEREGEGVMTQEFRHGISSYDYLEVFGHYATEVMTKRTRVRVTEMGEQFVSRELRIDGLEQSAASFKPQIMRGIASRCVERGEMEIGELMEEMERESGATAEVVHQHVARLMKYGILDLSPEDAPRAPSAGSPKV